MRQLPFTKKDIEKIISTHPTPFYLYDEAGIQKTVKKLLNAFSWNEGFREYFAVKALPNPNILEILKSEGCGLDTSSMGELVLAERVGVVGENIMFTSNNTPKEEYQKARTLGAIINLDDISHIEYLEINAGIPDIISFRYNPGEERHGNTIIGEPKEAKFGLTKDQMFSAYKTMKEKGVKRFGLHAMVASNELNEKYFLKTAEMIFDLASEISKSVGINFEFINLGGGIGIPYQPDEEEIDIDKLAQGIKNIYEEKIIGNGLPPLALFMECGRYITGPHGYLISTVIHQKDIYKKYVGLDATMANLMRPGMYGSYHHITVLGKEDIPHTETYDVTGSLCENNDKFAINRPLPKIEIGDIVVIHDTGAHGHSMGFNYNATLRSAEILLKENKETKLIRRAETLDDYFATLKF